MKIVCFTFYQCVVFTIVMMLSISTSIAAQKIEQHQQGKGAKVTQVVFQTDWLENQKRRDYVRTHYVSAGQLLVLDFELTVSVISKLKSINVVLNDQFNLSQSWRKQIRVGMWHYQKQLSAPSLSFNANQLYPLSAVSDVRLSPKRALRINVLLWADYSLTPTYTVGKLQVNIAGQEPVESMFAIDKLAVSLPLLSAPIGVYEHRFDYSRQQNGADKSLNHCVALFAQQLGLQHKVGIAKRFANRRNRLVDIQGAEARFRSRFNQYFNGYPYEQTDLLYYEELARLHHTVSLRQFSYLNQQLQQVYERGLWLPDMVANEHLWLLMDNKRPEYAQYRSLLGNKQNIFGMEASLATARGHPMADSLVFEQTTDALEKLFRGMHVERSDFSAQGFSELGFKGKLPWLLNAKYKRAASWFVWRAGLNGYMQWHAQLRHDLTQDNGVITPTDAHFYYLKQSFEKQALNSKLNEQCLNNNGSMLVIDSQWLSMAMGAQDRRWLLWLAYLVHDKGMYWKQASKLLDEIAENIPENWRQLVVLAQDEPMYFYYLTEQIAEFSLLLKDGPQSK